MRISSRTAWAVVAVAAGAGLAAMYLPKRHLVSQHDDDDLRVDEASEDSFPASDPPSFSAPTGGPQAGDVRPVS